jgi:hypothetical protein
VVWKIMADVSPTLDLIDNALGQGASPTASAPKSAADHAISMIDAGLAGKLPAPVKPYETTARSVLMNAGAGANEMIAGAIGAPMDLATGMVNRTIGHVNRLAGDFGHGPIVDEIHPAGGSASVKQAMGLIGGNPDTLVPQNPAERMARGAGAGLAGAVLLPLGVEGVAGAAPDVIAPATASLARSTVGAPDAMNAAIGATSGAGAAGAAELVPDEYKPLAGLVGGLVGGAPVVAAHAATQGVKAAVGGITNQMTEAGAKGVVGREMTAAASDPAAAREALANQPHEIVPGSVGTTGQVAGDTGLLNWERGVRQQNAPAFNDREATQNAAQIAHLESMQPTGNAADLPGVIASQREAAARSAQANTAIVDALSGASVKSAETAQKTAVEGLQKLTPEASPTEVSAHFREARAAFEADHNAAIKKAEQAAALARAKSEPSAATPEQIGQNLRAPAEEARATAKDAVDKLYASLPKDIDAPTAGVAAKAKDIASGMLPESAPMAGEEARLFELAQNYGDKAPLANLNALRSSILSEKANLKRSNPQAYGRLGQLQGAVEDAVDHAIETRVAQDQVGVRRGTIAPEDALAARLEQGVNAANIPQEAVAVRGGLDGVGSGRSEGGNAGIVGSAGKTRVGSGNVAGSEGLPPATGGATPEAGGTSATGQVGASPLREANAAYKNLKETFDQGPVGDITGKNGRGQYDLSPAELTKKVFHPGDTGGEDVRAYVAAVGPEKANTALSDAAAALLHEKSVRPDGTLDPKKVDAWLAAHKTAIAELPAATRKRFETAATAQRAVEDAFEARRDAIDAFDKSAAGKLMGLRDPGDVVREVGSIISAKDGAQRMNQLSREVVGNQSARNGLRYAIAEHVINRFLPDRIDRAQAFLTDKADVLAKIFTEKQLDGISQKLEAAQTAGARLEGAKASRETAIKEAQASEKEALNRYDQTVLGKIMKTDGKANVLDKIGTIFNSSDSAKQMGLLAEEAAKVSGGTDALRKAVTEMIRRDYSTTAEAGTSGQLGLSRAALSKFMKENTETLEKVLTPDQVGRIRAIVEDQLRTNRSITATKLKGGSDTAQNLVSSNKTGGSILSAITRHASESGGTIAGAVLGGPAGALIGSIGSKAMAALRDAGLNRVDQIRVRAALDPQFGRALLEEVPKLPDRNAAALIALRARQLSVAGGMGALHQSSGP